jgi:transcriptional regulator with XRE-family HTH domain
MSQLRLVGRLSGKRAKAAQLVAEDRLSDEQIAARIGITRRQLDRWKKDPIFSAYVEETAQQLAEAIRGKGLVELQNRVAALNKRWDAMMAKLEERGLYVKQTTTIDWW